MSTVITLAGYPQSVGAKIMATAVVLGPAVYPAGGFVISARQFGMQYIEQVIVSTQRTDIALADYYCHGRLNITSLGSSATTAAIAVIAGTTGLEIVAGTNLAARLFVVTVIGF